MAISGQCHNYLEVKVVRRGPDYQVRGWMIVTVVIRHPRPALWRSTGFKGLATQAIGATITGLRVKASNSG